MWLFRGERTGSGFCLAKCLLVGKGGLHGNVLRISPALTVNSDETDEALAILSQACAQLPA